MTGCFWNFNISEMLNKAGKQMGVKSHLNEESDRGSEELTQLTVAERHTDTHTLLCNNLPPREKITFLKTYYSALHYC